MKDFSRTTHKKEHKSSVNRKAKNKRFIIKIEFCADKLSNENRQKEKRKIKIKRLNVNCK